MTKQKHELERHRGTVKVRAEWTMRSAPFWRFVVAESLGWLLFLTKTIFSCLKHFQIEKKNQKLFRHAAKFVCAINVFGSHQHSAVLGQNPSSRFVCAPSSSCVFACSGASCWQVSDSPSQNPSHRGRLSALGQTLSCSRAVMRRFLSFGFLT